VAIPMLLHRDVDFITALIDSWRTVFENLPAMVFFGICVAVLTFLALLPGVSWTCGGLVGAGTLQVAPLREVSPR